MGLCVSACPANESDDSVSLDTPKHSFPKEHHRDTNSVCSIASREASWKTPIWIVRPQSYVIANLNSSTSVQSSRLEPPRKVPRRAWTCNLEPIIVPCFRRASVYYGHKQINCYCLTIPSDSSIPITHVISSQISTVGSNDNSFIIRLWWSLNYSTRGLPKVPKGGFWCSFISDIYN